MSLKSWLSAAYTAVSLVAMLRPAIANEQPDVPKKFSASVANFFTGIYSVQLEGSTLLYRAPKHAKAVRISPTQQQWREFRRAIDDIDIWHWRSRYHGSSTDGDHWSLQIEYSDRLNKTGGYASYPEESASPGSCSRTTNKPFTRFREAVQRLLGDRSFGDRVGPLQLYELAELQLVSAHPSPNPREQWAEFLDPTGKVNRVWQNISNRHERSPQRSTYVGAENATLHEVTHTSVSLMEICQDAYGAWFERVTTMKKKEAR